MRKAFTLMEMLIVIVVLTILMSFVFKLGTLGSDSQKRTTTVIRLQCLENCLSGYYAAFGGYPPVRRHASPDPYVKVGPTGVQIDGRNENIFNDNSDSLMQIDTACRCQPVAAEFPFMDGMEEEVISLSFTIKGRIQDGTLSTGGNDDLKARALAGFDAAGADGGVGRFSKNKDKDDWRDIQLFKFGLMSFLLPRYLFMLGGDEGFYDGSFAQWNTNNSPDQDNPKNGPSDPFKGSTMTWLEMKEFANSDNRQDTAKLANIPSQAVCARWMPNLAGKCKGFNDNLTFFGVKVMGDAWLSADIGLDTIFEHIHSPNPNSFTDQYMLDYITVQDGWGRDFYYHSPVPHQKYILWSAGPNGRTFPPWISREKLDGDKAVKVAEWVNDDISHLSY